MEDLTRRPAAMYNSAIASSKPNRGGQGRGLNCSRPAHDNGNFFTEVRMLFLTSKPGQAMMIGEDIRVTVVGVEGGRVTLGIEAPLDQRILRGELQEYPEEPIIIEFPDPLKLTFIQIPTERIPPR